MIERTPLRRLTARHLTAPMRSAVCALARGNHLHTRTARPWLDTGFEAVLTQATFYGLLRRGLLRRVGRRRHVYTLSAKGTAWARMEWAPANRGSHG